MKNLLLTLCLGISFAAWGQSKKGNSNISVSLSPQYYLNGPNVQNDGILPDPIQTKNTFGWYVGVEFERVTRYGFSMSAGLRTGVRRHSFSFTRNLADFDSTATSQLKDVVYNKSFAKSLYYINPVISIGYQKQVSKNWTVVAKAGLFITCYLNGFLDVGNVDLTYQTDDLSEIKDERVLSYQVMIGEPQRDLKNRRFSLLTELFGNTQDVGFFYLGVTRPFHYKPIKSLSVGIEFSRTLYRDAIGLQWAEVKTRTHASSYDGSIDTYQDQCFSIGLRVGAQLWK